MVRNSGPRITLGKVCNQGASVRGIYVYWAGEYVIPLCVTKTEKE